MTFKALCSALGEQKSDLAPGGIDALYEAGLSSSFFLLLLFFFFLFHTCLPRPKYNASTISYLFFSAP